MEFGRKKLKIYPVPQEKKKLFIPPEEKKKMFTIITFREFNFSPHVFNPGALPKSEVAPPQVVHALPTDVLRRVYPLG